MYSAHDTSNYNTQLIDIKDCLTLQQVDDKLQGFLDTAEKVQLYHYYDHPETTPRARFDSFGSHQGLRNSRTHVPYGVCTKKYELIQNKEAFQSLEHLVTAGDAHFDKAAIWGNGASTYLTVCNKAATVSYTNDSLQQINDPVKNNLFALNDQSGSWALNFGNHIIRMFCLNQLPSMSGWLSNRVTFKHTATSKNKIAAINELTKDSCYAFDKTIETYETLASSHMTSGTFETFAETLLNNTWGDAYETLEPDEGSYQYHLLPRRAKKIEDLTKLYLSRNQDAGLTRWGALQAVTAWRDHNPKISYLSNLRGASKNLKTEALRLLLN